MRLHIPTFQTRPLSTLLQRTGALRRYTMSPVLNRRFVRAISLLWCALLFAELLHAGPTWAGRRRSSKDDPDDVPPATVAAPAETSADEHQRRLDAIASLQQLIGSSNTEGEQKAEMLFRLADLYLAEGRAVRDDEVAAGEAASPQQTWMDPWGGSTPPPEDSASKTWFQKAIKLATQITSSFPQYARADEVTFLLGSALREDGQSDEAVRQFSNLVKLYPESRNVPDAYVQIGEYYFDRNEAYQALRAYQHATRFPEYDQRTYANYKLAWCYYNITEYPRAIETMKAVVTDPAAASTAVLRGGRVLREEALVALVTFFADAGDLVEAETYFGKPGERSLYLQTLERAAFNDMQSGRYEESINLYTRLIRESDNSVDIARYQQMLSAARSKQVVEAERKKEAEAAARVRAQRRDSTDGGSKSGETVAPTCDKTSCGPSGKRDEKGCCLEPEL